MFFLKSLLSRVPLFLLLITLYPHSIKSNSVITVPLPPEFLSNKIVSPCDTFRVSCTYNCLNSTSKFPDSESCTVNSNAEAKVECTCNSNQDKSYDAAKIFTLTTVEVPQSQQPQFCQQFVDQCQTIANNTNLPIAVNACRPTENGTPDQYYATCITVSTSEFFRNEQQIFDELIPARPKLFSINHQAGDQACTGFTSLCHKAIGSSSNANNANVNICNKYGATTIVNSDNLEVQCSKGDTDYTDQVVQDLIPVQLTIPGKCLSTDICGEFQRSCGTQCNQAVAFNACYVPYLVNRYAFGCICTNGELFTKEAFTSITANC